MKRRSFLEAMGLAGAAGATLAANPASLFVDGGAPPIPIEGAGPILEQVAQGTVMNVALLERDGSRVKQAAIAPTTLQFEDDLSKVTKFNYDERGYQASATWEVTKVWTLCGVRVWGAEVEGKPWTKFAYFTTDVTLNNGDKLTVNYALTP